MPIRKLSLRIPIWVRARIELAADFARVRALKMDWDYRRKQTRTVHKRMDDLMHQLMLLEFELHQARTSFVSNTIDEQENELRALPNTKEFFKQKKAVQRGARTLPPDQLKQIADYTKTQVALNAEVTALKVRVTQLELEEYEAFKARMSAEAELQMKIGNMLIGARTLADRTTAKMDRYEANVLKREQTAKVALSKTQETFEKTTRPLKNSELGVDATSQDKVNPLTTAMLSLGKFFEVADPSVENAYARLSKRIFECQRAAEKSEEAERMLEQSIERLQNNSGNWQRRAESFDAADSESPILRQVRSRQRSVDEASAELSAALVAHKTKNLATAQMLFRVEGLAQRLGLLKSLLAALPNHSRDDLILYAQIVEAVCNYIQSAILQNDEARKKDLKQESPVLSQRIYALEQKLLLTYIEFAKVDLKSLSPKLLLNFKSDCGSMLSALQLEKNASMLELAKWEIILKQAIDDNMQLLQSVAEQRIEQYSGVVRMANQSIDVLSAVCTAVSG